MSLNYVTANSLRLKLDRMSELATGNPYRRPKVLVNNNNNVTSVSTGFPTPAPVAGNALYFNGLGHRLGIRDFDSTSAIASWNATSGNSTDGGLNGKLGFGANGQLTIETFICFPGTGSFTSTTGWYESGNNGLALGYNGSNLYFATSQVSFGVTFATALTRGVWYHIAFTRFNNGSTNVIQCWLNGTKVGNDGTSGVNYTGVDPFSSAISPYIGGGNGASGFGLQAYLQEYRISNIRRYTANFTPTTVPFTNDENTLLLIHGSSPIIDDNTTN